MHHTAAGCGTLAVDEAVVRHSVAARAGAGYTPGSGRHTAAVRTEAAGGKESRTVVVGVVERERRIVAEAAGKGLHTVVVEAAGRGHRSHRAAAAAAGLARHTGDHLVAGQGSSVVAAVPEEELRRRKQHHKTAGRVGARTSPAHHGSASGRSSEPGLSAGMIGSAGVCRTECCCCCPDVVAGR